MKKVLVISMVMVFAMAMMAGATVHNWTAYVTSYTGSQDGVVIGQWAGATDALTDTDIDPMGMDLSEPQTDQPGPATTLLKSGGSHVDIRDIADATCTWTIAVTAPGSTVKIDFGYSYNDNVAGWGAPYDVNDYLPVGTTFTVSGIGTGSFAASAVSSSLQEQSITVSGPGTLTITASNVQAPQTPEPGSMLALGSGLVGLVGFAIRRRK